MYWDVVLGRAPLRFQLLAGCLPSGQSLGHSSPMSEQSCGQNNGTEAIRSAPQSFLPWLDCGQTRHVHTSTIHLKTFVVHVAVNQCVNAFGDGVAEK